MIKLIFVCTGNICRSAMAHHYMQKKVEEMHCENEFLIDSAGTFAITGDKAPQNNINSMKNYDIDLIEHRAKNIQDMEMETFDIILTFTKYHKETIVSQYPILEPKVFTLREYIDPTTNYKDIDDPWGYSLQVYEACANEIVKDIDILIQKMKGSEKQ